MPGRLSPVLVAIVLVAACTNISIPTPTPTPGASGQHTPAPTGAGPSPTIRPSGDQPQVVTGSVTYTNTYFTAGVSQPEIILEDQGGFVTRNRNFEISEDSQVIGQLTSDFNTSPFTYSLTLPAQPHGSLHDVDHDGQTDQGVEVFAVAYWNNIWGGPKLEIRDQGGGGWSSAYASTKVSDAAASYLEVYGGKYLVYAPDATEEFPSGFGTDKKLFTDDDPVMPLEKGWSVVDLDQSPFAVSRDPAPTMDLFEPESSALDDFSSQSYAQAFDAMLDKFRHEYAWTGLKHINWDAEAAQFRPAFVQADATHDPHAYALALRNFIWSIPDTHVYFDDSLLNDDYSHDLSGGLGFAITETDDGKFLVNYVTPGESADKAGIEFGAEIVALDGRPTGDVVSADVPWSSGFSNPIVKRIEQAHEATRFPLSKGNVEVKFANRGSAVQTATLAVTDESDSFYNSYGDSGNPFQPVEFQVLPTNPEIGYIRINSFFQDQVETITEWEDALRSLITGGISRLVLDMRTNGGGNGWLADQMAAYFFDHRIAVGTIARYDPSSDSFYTDPTDEDEMIPPPSELQFTGQVAVMVGPQCASACEFFSYDMTLENRATIVGQYPSEGAGGSVEQFIMPEGIAVTFTVGRAVDAEGNVHLEGKGVVPTVRVPVNFDTLQQLANGDDPVLDAAERALGATP